ncbi:hypothetical protein BC937DRAFT_95535 [Endogone sp. FLAS-F59071]|nr:hypothetical protein BC937DRAFT_95535 [Endogone sp. FLAS-F59071]|eukprot:RUS20286.1 hypothetical protein BC937DRAFT_95535 [Endogone sp. FLAS-F59071]
MERFLKLIRRNSWSSSNATEVERNNSQNLDDGNGPRRRKNSSASLLNVGVRRRVYVNQEIPSAELDEYGYPLARYASNRIQTAKYTVISFLPKNLFEQFRGVANLYFLFLVILQMFPIFGATEPGLAVMPIGAILLITAIKDAVEDYKRHKSDEAVNKAKTKTLKGWRNVNEMDAVDRRASRWQIFSRLLKYCLSCFGYRVSSRRDSIDAAKARQRSARPKARRSLQPNDDFVEITQDGLGSLRTHTLKARNIFAKEPRRKKKPYRPGMIPHSVIRRTPTRPEDLDAATAIQNGVPLEAVLTNCSAMSAQDSSCTSRWCETLWEEVRVGDLVYLGNDEAVPADIIILATSEPDGLCYVETQNLDGETNLKIRRSLNATNELRTPADCEKAQFYIESEPPHANLYSYNGVLRWSITNEEDGESDDEYSNPGVAHTKTEAITHNEILLRGHVLRNTGFVIGLVMFTGDDTKIMLNSGKTPSKRSKMEKGTNPHVSFWD